MITRRAMTLIEVLAATAMLAFIASALIGLGMTVMPQSNPIGDPDNARGQTERLAELRSMDANTIESNLNPDEQMQRIESVSADPENPSPGDWITIQTPRGLIMRWVPASDEDENGRGATR